MISYKVADKITGLASGKPKNQKVSQFLGYIHFALFNKKKNKQTKKLQVFSQLRKTMKKFSEFQILSEQKHFCNILIMFVDFKNDLFIHEL